MSQNKSGTKKEEKIIIRGKSEGKKKTKNKRTKTAK